MQRDEDSPGNVTTPSGAPDAKGLRPEPIDERLFEDILDLEGALRLTTQATAGLGAPRAGEIEALSRDLPEPAGAILKARAEEIRAATKAGDVTRVREAQLGVIDTLVKLRATFWFRDSGD